MTKTIHRVSLRPFNPEQETKVLMEWLRAPHVRQWWGDPQKQLELILAGFVEGEQSIIIADDVAVGYLQWEKISKEELDSAGLTEIPEGSIDIDIAIGNVNYSGCNHAPRVLRHLIQTTLQHVPAPMILMSTSVNNTRARRAFEKAGFMRQRTFDDPEYGKMVLFKFN